MSQDSYGAQILGVFFAETLKNVAKGSANILYNHFNSLFNSEITTLGLNDGINAEDITKQLEARPEVLEIVQQKLNAHPELAEQMKRIFSEYLKTNSRTINTQTYVEKAENLTINQFGENAEELLYSILKKDIERDNDTLKQRKALAKELIDNCKLWSSELISTFDRAAEKWVKKKNGKVEAMAEIEALQQDFLKLDYYSLRSNSPVLRFLKEDSRFEKFAESCIRFYESALYVKRMAYEGIEATPGHYISIRNAEIKATVNAWKKEVERMFEDLTGEYLKIKIILPK